MRQLGARSRVGTRIQRKSKNAVWAYRPMIDGKQYWFPLGFDKRQALDLADKIRAAKTLHPVKEVIEMFHKKRFQAEKDPTPTIADVEKRLNDNQVALGIAKKTVKDYMDNLKRIARVMLNTKDVDDFDCGELNASFINGYKVLAFRVLRMKERFNPVRERSTPRSVAPKPSLITRYLMDFVPTSTKRFRK